MSGGRWARIPGSYWRERAGAVSLAAHGLYALGRSYCADQRSDGLIPVQWIGGMCGGKVDAKAVASLVAAGWWALAGDAYRDVRYLDENISREQADVRAAKTLGRVQKHRGKSEGGNDDGNGGGNKRRNGVTEHVTQDSHDDHDNQDDHDARASRSDARARLATPAGIVESALIAALGAVPGARLVLASGDARHLSDAAAAMAASDSRPLRDVAAEWCPGFVAEFRVRTAKNLASYASSRAANGGKPISKGAGWRPPTSVAEYDASATEAPTDGPSPEDLARLERLGRRPAHG